MKLALVILFLSCFSTYGMTVSDCPRVFSLSLKELNLSAPSESPDAQNLVNRLNRTGHIQATLTITFAGAGRCHYEGRNIDGSFYWATLYPNPSPIKSALELKLRSNEMQIKIPVQGISPKGIHLTEEMVDLYYKEKTRGSMEFPIGSATLQAPI